jgi:hypothetical protein
MLCCCFRALSKSLVAIVIAKCAARFISGITRSDHTTPILNKLHWLRVPERIEFKVLLVCHKYIIGTAPSYLRELVTSCTPGHNLRSSDGLLLLQRRARLVSYGDGAFSCAAPKLCNDLPQSVRKICCTPVFVRHLKTHLFSRYSGPSAKM